MRPELTILSRPVLTGDHAEFLKLKGLRWKPVGECTEAEALIEFAGRTCYLSFDPKPRTRVATRAYVAKLVSSGHESVLEHAQWTFQLSGVTRGFSHQLVRHRVGFAFSQLSQQYHDESEAELIQPFEIESREDLKSKWRDAQKSVNEFYEAAISSGAPEQDMSERERIRYARSLARSLLPNSTRTIICVSANARALRHFLSVRGNLDGDLEMRLVSEKIFDLLRSEAPSTVGDFSLEYLSDGTPRVLRKPG